MPTPVLGMPIGYHHWSFGKKFISTEQHYKRGQMGLAYEIVINADPCISYLMEENTLPMQALVMAHACYGHNSFFRNNYLFKTWTDASSIIDYLLFARHYISDCGEHHGVDAVEALLDSCHALMNYGVDRYKRPQKISLSEEKRRQKRREEYLQTQVNELWRTLPKATGTADRKPGRFPSEPQENILYFIEKHAPLLEPWQREIIRIVRKISQYFYPQKQTQVMNEGWATFWHYTISNHLYDEGLLTDRFMLEFLHNHTMWSTSRPITAPTIPASIPTLWGLPCSAIYAAYVNHRPRKINTGLDYAGSDWLTTLHFAMENFKDESFISQFLSPTVMRDLRLFAIDDNDQCNYLQVSAIHNEEGYRRLRQKISAQYNLSQLEPNIQVYNVALKGDRSDLALRPP